MTRSFLAAAASVTLAVSTAAPTVSAPPSKKALTLEVVTAEGALVSPGATRMTWRTPRKLAFVVPEGNSERSGRGTFWELDADTGAKAKLLDPVSTPDGKPLPFRGSLWSPDGGSLLLSGEDDLWLYGLADKKLTRLTNDDAEEEFPEFSPDGSRIAYVKGSDLYAVGTADGKEKRLTTSGGDHVLNGKLDWVYEEELANRRSGRSFEWAPDSSAIAYLRLDETRVPEYPVVDFLPTNGKLQPQRYPKAGDPNSVASVHVVDVNGKDGSLMVAAGDGYVAPELSWTADSRSVCALVLDRAQAELSVLLVPRGNGGPSDVKVLLVEKDPAWINAIEPPRFLKDGSGFVFLSERSGFFHLYRHDMTGKLVNAVTQGPWMVDDAWEVDEKNGLVYFVATEKDPRARHAYRVKLDGSGFQRLTDGRGSHGLGARGLSLDLSPDGAFFVDRFSEPDKPPKTALVSADGKARTVFDEPANRLGDYEMATTEMGSFTGNDGTLFYTQLVKPPGFSPKKKYPVIVYVYGGPHAQVVQDRWGTTSLSQHLWAARGFLVFSMDNRGSWGRGHAFETPILKKLGEVELKDQLEGVAHLKKLPYVDAARIGITGWSYGGYMTLFAATNAPGVFKVAVAGAPVTHWKFYDSIYTERYMKLPKDNPDGYKAASPLEAAGKLNSKLLILHGTSDDNVHMQNSIAFADALMRAQKDYTFVPLPRQMHGPREPAAREYTARRILEFFEKNL